MRNRILLFAALSASLLFSSVSCRRNIRTGPEVLPFVRQVVTDSAGIGLFDRVCLFEESNTAGTITLIGESKRCLQLTARLLSGDGFDNVDGHSVEDGLPDFAGEQVAAILDERGGSYADYVKDGRTVELRERAVRLFLAALDTAVRVSPFDREHLRNKPVAKLVVLVSPALSAYGYADIDTLVRLSGKNVPLLSPAHVMLTEALSGEGKAHVGVMLDGEVPGSAVYEEVFRTLVAGRGELAGSTLTAYVPDTTGTVGDRFVRFLEMYRDAGKEAPLNCLLVEDGDANLFELRDRLAEIRRTESFETLGLNKLLAKDFRFIPVVEALTDACYELMRQRNLFTHFVSYPTADYYVTAEAAPVEEIPFTLIALNRRYLSEESLQMLEYVQN